MIKVTFTIIEEKGGAIRFRGLGQNIGTPTNKEVSFTKDLMMMINKVTGPGDFVKTQDKIPMTIITWVDKDKENEHPNRN